jgi:hypothetical protein
VSRRITIGLILTITLFTAAYFTHEQWISKVNEWSMMLFGFIPGWHISLTVECLIFALIPLRTACLSYKWRPTAIRHFIWAFVIDLGFLFLLIWGTFHLCRQLTNSETQWLPSSIVSEPFPFFGSSIILLGSFIPMLMLLFKNSRESTLDENQGRFQ